MARKPQNPQQIIRLDGKNSFLEVMNNAFPIGKVLINFYQYDKNAPTGSKFTNEIQLYLNIKDFNVFYYKTIFNGSLIRQIQTLAADPTKKNYEKQIVIHRGGSENNGALEARQLKIFQGTAKPIVLQAEVGKGKKNAQGGFTMDGLPTKYISIGMDYDDLINLLIKTHDSLVAYFAYVSVKENMGNEIAKLQFGLEQQNKLMKLMALRLGIAENEINDIINAEMPKPVPYYQQNNQNKQQYQPQQQQYGYQQQEVPQQQYYPQEAAYPQYQQQQMPQQYQQAPQNYPYQPQNQYSQPAQYYQQQDPFANAMNPPQQ